MAEYIEREAALQIIDYAKQLTSEQIVRESGTYELLSDTEKACYDGIITTLDMCKRLINEGVIAADVQPIKHGKWLHINDDGIIFCSDCENEAYWDTDYGQQLFDFCPYCGARMDGDTE